MKTKYPERIRFNWGYHNGANPKIQEFAPKANHFDKLYIRAWYLGKADFELGVYDGTSDKAWETLQHERNEKRSQRKALPQRTDLKI